MSKKIILSREDDERGSIEFIGVKTKADVFIMAAFFVAYISSSFEMTLKETIKMIYELIIAGDIREDESKRSKESNVVRNNRDPRRHKVQNKRHRPKKAKRQA